MGSGRDTLLELLIGRSRPTVGTLRLAGIDPLADREQFSRRVGVLFSKDTLYAQGARFTLRLAVQDLAKL